MKKAIQRLKNERGLTLVELLAVIVILAIIMIIAFVFIGGIIDNSKKDAHIANAQQIIAAAKLYDATGNEIPNGGEVSVKDLQTANYLDQLLDPWSKNSYEKLDEAKVTKDDEGGYSIKNFNAQGCKLDGKSEADLSKDGRDNCN